MTMKYEPDPQPDRPVERRAPTYTERQAQPYEPRPISPEDFVALREWVKIRAPHLNLSLDHTEDDADYISVTLAPDLIPQDFGGAAFDRRSALWLHSTPSPL